MRASSASVRVLSASTTPSGRMRVTRSCELRRDAPRPDRQRPGVLLELLRPQAAPAAPWSPAARSRRSSRCAVAASQASSTATTTRAAIAGSNSASRSLAAKERRTSGDLGPLRAQPVADADHRLDAIGLRAPACGAAAGCGCRRCGCRHPRRSPNVRRGAAPASAPGRGRSSSRCSRRNSVAVSASALPPHAEPRGAAQVEADAAASRTVGRRRPPAPRRRTALMRSTSSRGLKGLVT